ncbi:PREDICTED: venom serine protease Bi-VSP-like [Papilio xuthus]|uniref:Venom serine protease Bi-VSP-like n=1 Tax=Papilio xuthus TaxID=66420 RepID=A0AAJ6Z606_PAPXU|nr:PREDICTED: venom serine protease Bi-VSP-like [Papilio xuthus]
MKKVIILLLFTLLLVNCDDGDYEIGSVCTTNTNEAGVCKYLYECPYALNRLRKRTKIKDCLYEDDKRYVCCAETTKITPATSNPLEQKPRETISDRELVKFHEEGLLKGGDIECRFNGTFPVKCCRIVHDFTTLKFNEPPKCPELEKPYARSSMTPHQSVIYDACYAYSRLGSKCLASDINTDWYVRDDCQRFRSITKISDGDPAKVSEFPHMAVLGGRKDAAKPISWIGGGTLISEYFILTAAHAVGSRDTGVVNYALLGTIYKNDTRSGELYHVVKIIKYPEYNSQTKKNDIALLKVHTRVIFSDYIRPACLPFPGSKEYEYTSCTVAGWGSMGERQNTSDVLLKATVFQEYNHSRCKDVLHQNFFVWDSNTMICAKSGESRPNQDTCKGDSGGPLMTLSKQFVRCSYFVAGVVSWGPRCGFQLYGSYTNSSYYKYQEWIVENAWPQQLKARNIILS